MPPSARKDDHGTKVCTKEEYRPRTHTLFEGAQKEGAYINSLSTVDVWLTSVHFISFYYPFKAGAGDRTMTVSTTKMTSVELTVPVSHLAPQSQTQSYACTPLQSDASHYCLIELPASDTLSHGDDWSIKAEGDHADAWLVRESQNKQGATFRLKKILATNRLLLFSGVDMVRTLDCYYEATLINMNPSFKSNANITSPTSFLDSYLATDALYPSLSSFPLLKSLDDLKLVVPVSDIELQTILHAYHAFVLDGKIRRLTPSYANLAFQFIKAWMASQEVTDPCKILEHEHEFIDLYPIQVIEHVLKLYQDLDWS